MAANYKPVIGILNEEGTAENLVVLKSFSYENLREMTKRKVSSFRLYSVEVPSHIERVGGVRLAEWVSYQIARGSCFFLRYNETKRRGVWVSTSPKK